MRSEFGVQMDHKSKNHTMLQLEGASKTSSVKTKQIKAILRPCIHSNNIIIHFLWGVSCALYPIL